MGDGRRDGSLLRRVGRGDSRRSRRRRSPPARISRPPSKAGDGTAYASICDTDSCQAYVGENFESSQPTPQSTRRLEKFESRTGQGQSSTPDTPRRQEDGRCRARSRRSSTAATRVSSPASRRVQSGPHLASNRAGRRCPGNSDRSVGLRIVVMRRNHRGSLGGRVAVDVIGLKGSSRTRGQFAALLGLDSDWFAAVSPEPA